MLPSGSEKVKLCEETRVYGRLWDGDSRGSEAGRLVGIGGGLHAAGAL